MKPFLPRLFLRVSHGLSDFLRDGSRAFSLIMLWMNVFCGMFIWSYWRVVELTAGKPPKEMTAGVVVIVLTYLVGDTLANVAYLKAVSGGYEQVPDQLTDNSQNTVANGQQVDVNAATGSDPVVNATPNTQQD